MPVHHLVVTPLPNGRSGATLFLSVHLSPRLREAGALADYPDVADWGAFVAGGPPLAFTPLVNGKVRPGATTTVVSPPVDPRVWRATFGDPRAVPVAPYTFRDRSRLDLTAIDSAELSEQVMALARDRAAVGGGRATRAEVRAAAGPLLDTVLPAAQDWMGQVGDGETPGAPSKEFHDQLGALGAHPFLMRALGLVFDLEVTLPPGGAPVTTIAVRTTWPAKVGLTPHDEVPMRVAVDGAFKARVDQPEFRVTDWLALGGAKYAVAQLDRLNAITQVGQMADAVAAASDPDAGIEVPALLEGGLSLVCGDLDDVLRRRLARQRQIEDGIDAWLTSRPNAVPPQLFAEDVTAGYRCDVADDVAPDRLSLHDRQVPDGYVFPRNTKLTVLPPPDEGWGSIALSTDGTEQHVTGGSGVVYHQEGSKPAPKVEARDTTAWRVDDQVVTWGGWSLSTPRVGASSTGAGEVVARTPNGPGDGPARVGVEYAHVPGTLPKLRYGRTYKLRARCVDLAGNGPALADVPPPGGEAPPTQFGRLAPLVPPLPVRRASRPDPGVGDLPDVLVIRSELDQPTSDIAPTDRLLFPPRISQSRLERHDLPGGGNDKTPESYQLLVARDAVSLSDQTLVDPETGELVAGGALVGDEVTEGPLKPPVDYLADPVARRAALIGLPGGVPADPELVSYGTWPDVEAAQLELRAGTGAPTTSAADRRVTVELPPGTVATAELASAPAPDLIDHMALAQDLDPAARAAARRGLNQAISPRRPISLVHAVRLPIDPPRLRSMTGDRTEAGQTDVVLGGTLAVHRPTTEHAVLRSSWVDTVDDPATDGPVDQVTKRIVADVQIPVDGDDPPSLDATSLELGDTRRRVVDVVAEGFCRFSRYFTERIDFAADPAAPLALHAEGVVPASVVLTRREDGATMARGTQFRVSRDGTLTILDDAALPPGTPCRVEFIPRPVSRLSLEARNGQRFSVDVPASAAPAPPVVVAAVPAVQRTVTPTETAITVSHDGRVVRLLLDRPWFDSGTGELLGVVVGDGLTRWGRDPIVDGPGPSSDPTLAAFPDGVLDGDLDVAGYEVTFDPERKLWMADVLVDAGEDVGYRPFVQLAVCRYQPNAVPGLNLSPTVEVAPVRLGALREVTVAQVAPGAGRASVRLSGLAAGNQVRVITQEADTGVSDPDLRWHDVATVVLSPASATGAAVYTGVVDLPTSGADRRVVIEDAEPVTVDDDGTAASSTVVAYREVVEIPGSW